MKIKFSIGPGNTLVASGAANVVSEANYVSDNNFVSNDSIGDSQYLNSRFFYVSTAENGIASRADNGAPEKIETANIPTIFEENPRSIIGLFNFENVFDSNGVQIATAAAQGVFNADQSLYSLSIYKKEIWYDRETQQPMEQEVWTPVALEESSRIIRDFNIGNGRYYKYAFRLVENKAGGGVEHQSGIVVPIKTNWQGWSIVELHETDDPKVFTAAPKDVWKFKYNVSTGAQTQNISKTQQDTLSRYPIFSHGVKNAVSGSVTCLLGREMINADYTNKEWVYTQDPNTTEPSLIWQETYGATKNLGGYKERLGRTQSACGSNVDYLSASALGFRNLTSNEAVDMLDKWRDVCYSGNPKLLKDEKGQTFVIQITDPTNTTNETWDRQPEEISFNWVEIADAKDCRVIQSD